MISRQTNAPPANKVHGNRLAFNSREDANGPFNHDVDHLATMTVMFCLPLPIAPAFNLPYAGSQRGVEDTPFFSDDRLQLENIEGMSKYIIQRLAMLRRSAGQWV